MDLTQIMLTSNSGKSVSAEARIDRLHLGKKLKRGFKGSALGLGLAFLSLPLPGLHFVLVPGFLGLAIWLLHRRWKEGFQIISPNIACPDCKQSLDKKELYLTSESIPIRFFCYSCGSQLSLTPSKRLIHSADGLEQPSLD